VARDGDVVEEDLAVGRAADPRALAARAEALARAPAAGAHDERGPVEPLDRRVRELADLVGREGLRRLRPALSLLEQRPAARAVVRGFRVLEPALAAIHMAHERGYAGGAARPERISVSRSTSTSSRTLRPPDACSRATSS